MSIRDYQKTQYHLKYTVYNVKELKKITKQIEKDLVGKCAQNFEVELVVNYLDRNS